MLGEKNRGLIDDLIELNKKHDKLVPFIDKLVYGKSFKCYNVLTGAIETIIFHLHPTSPEILIATLPKGGILVFDLTRTRLDRVDLSLQGQYKAKAEQSIIMEDDEEELCVIFESKFQKEVFCKHFRSMCELMRKNPKEFDPMIMKYFIKTDTNRNMSLSRAEVQKLFHDIKLRDEKEVSRFDSYLSHTNEFINLTDFEKMLKFLLCRHELLPVFKKYTKFKLANAESAFLEALGQEQFGNFLREEQKESEKVIPKIVERVFNTTERFSHKKISFYDFCTYVMSQQNEAFDPEYLEFGEDNHPLQSYYCYSSHNTYLTGNQLTSDSHAERYFEDLSEGVRCVEIDCHDGSNGPIVKHGYTATKSISFASVIDEIERFCKENPDHSPVIISIENHCGNDNQMRMASYIMKVMKDRVIFVSNSYPILRQLQGKVIIRSTGSLEIYKEVVADGEGGDEEAIVKEMIPNPIEQDLASESSKFIFQKIIESTNNEMFLELNSLKRKFESYRERLAEGEKNFIQAKATIKEHFEGKFEELKKYNKSKILNRMLVKITGMFNSGYLTENEGSPWESISFSDTKIEKASGTVVADRIRHYAERSWLRVYPSGHHIDSSNYDPLTAMEFGAQIIALNTQKKDYYNHIMKTFFKKGSKVCKGYRLKPDELPERQSNHTISVTPLSAHRIYYNDRSRKHEIPRVHVRMRYFGVTRDREKNQSSCNWASYTEVIVNNACNPVFKESEMMTLRLSSEELGFIAIEVPECGIAILPIDNIRRGYRPVTLYDNQYEPKDSKIVCLFA